MSSFYNPNFKSLIETKMIHVNFMLVVYVRNLDVLQTIA